MGGFALEPRLADNQMTAKRIRVLLIAYACRPGESSEREVGWGWANLIQSRHDVTVLTRKTHKKHIESYLASGKHDGCVPNFLYYDLPDWVLRFKRGAIGLYLYYSLWTYFGTKRIKALNIDKRWELTHFLTFGTILWPQFSYLMKTPYVLGPVGGGERITPMMLSVFSFRDKVQWYFRRAFQYVLIKCPFTVANLNAANRILVRTHETRDYLPKHVQEKTELLLETAQPEWTIGLSISERGNDVLQIVTVGRLIFTKINKLTFEAIADFKSEWGKPFRFTIVGDGPERDRLEKIAYSLGLDEVVFVGNKSRQEVMQLLRSSDIYFSTTTKEGGTWAFFEAIGNKLPIVCLKVNGPDMIVGDGCGVKVNANDYATARAELKNALICLARDEQLRESYAEKALNYANDTYSWERILSRIDEIYNNALLSKTNS